jgi:hypothetical protein
MDDKLKVVSNIKSVGWATLIVFSILEYLILIRFIITFLIKNNPLFPEFHEDNKEFAEALSEIDSSVTSYFIILIIILAFLSLTNIGAVGLIKLKNWGLIIFHSTSIILICSIIVGLAYATYSYKSNDNLPLNNINVPVDEYLETVQYVSFIGYGTLLLVITWILTRANILLIRRDYRIMFC